MSAAVKSPCANAKLVQGHAVASSSCPVLFAYRHNGCGRGKTIRLIAMRFVLPSSAKFAIWKFSRGSRQTQDGLPVSDRAPQAGRWLYSSGWTKRPSLQYRHAPLARSTGQGEVMRVLVVEMIGTSRRFYALQM
jgi:hypothetical protein